MNLKELGIYYSAPDLMIVCVDGCRNSDIYGRIYYKQSSEPVPFPSTAHMLKEMDAICERLGYPQAAMKSRSFRRKSAADRENTDMKKAEGDRNEEELNLDNQGEEATFVVHIKYRQNATWQGSVTWAEKKQSCNFRSALELLKLMDSAMDDDEEENE